MINVINVCLKFININCFLGICTLLIIYNNNVTNRCSEVGHSPVCVYPH